MMKVKIYNVLFSLDIFSVIKRSYWEDILGRNNLNEVDIRDTRYNQIIHMVSAANGAEPFYTTEVSK